MQYSVIVKMQWHSVNYRDALEDTKSVACKLEETMEKLIIGEPEISTKTTHLATKRPGFIGYTAQATLKGIVEDREDTDSVSETCCSIMADFTQVLFEIDFQPIPESEGTEVTECDG